MYSHLRYLEQEAGLRLDADRSYSFLVQVDYDMGYFFGQVGGSAGGTGQGLPPVNSVGAGEIEWCAAFASWFAVIALDFLCPCSGGADVNGTGSSGSRGIRAVW